jgi:voltage-gated potassium channel
VAVLMSEQFDGLETKVDGLYFALVTLTTVGFGDIVPVGQTARAVVTVQVAFDLVVVTTAVSILSRGRPRATEDS